LKTFRIAACLALASALAACVTASPHGRDAASMRQLGLADVKVEIPDTARLSWPEEEQAARRTHLAGPNATQALADDGAVRAHVTRALSNHIRTALMGEVGRELNGPRKVRAVVTVKYFNIPSVAERVLVNNTATFDAHITLVDARTNVEIVTYPGSHVSAMMVGGLMAPVAEATQLGGSDRSRQLMFEYTDKFRKWLLNT
jgi:hypothetical protein